MQSIDPLARKWRAIPLFYRGDSLPWAVGEVAAGRRGYDNQ
jgi:hypothetical protein